MLRTLLVLALAAAPAAAQSAPTHPGLVYADLGGTDLRLDLYVPPGPGPHPVVVWIHGGGWSGGSRFPIPNGAAGLVARGIAVASVDYRLTSEAGRYGALPVTFPAQIEDVKGAVRWLRAHAPQYGLDPARVGSWGSSAGGHLSALLAVSGSVAELEGTTGGNLAFSSAVQAGADWFGPADLLRMNPDVTVPPGSTLDHDAPSSPESRLIGFDQPGEGIGVLRAHELDPTPPYPFFVDRVHDASPLTWLDANDPPMLLAHGTLDTVVPMKQSARLADGLRAAGVPYAHDQVVGAGHGLGGARDLTVQLFFVQRFFGTQPVASFCSADAASAACPCANEGLSGHGCANSQPASGGALLVAGGAAEPGSMTLQAVGMPANALCIFLQGDQELAAPVGFGDGLRCVAGTLVRLSTRPAVQGAASFPDPAAGDPSIQATSAARGAPIPAGASRGYQVYYRDTTLAFCPAPQGHAFNVGNAVRIGW